MLTLYRIIRYSGVVRLCTGKYGLPIRVHVVFRKEKYNNGIVHSFICSLTIKANTVYYAAAALQQAALTVTDQLMPLFITWPRAETGTHECFI